MLLGPTHLLGSRELKKRRKDSSLGSTCRLGLREVQTVSAAGGLEVKDTGPLLCGREGHTVSWDPAAGTGSGAGREAHPGSAGRCTRHPRDTVGAGPGSGPRAARAPPDTAVHHPRSRRGTHSAVCSGQESRRVPFRDWGTHCGTPAPARLPCSPGQYSGSRHAHCSPLDGHPHRGCGPGSSIHHPHSLAGRHR